MFDSKYYATFSYKVRQLIAELEQLKSQEAKKKYEFPEFDIIQYRVERVKLMSSIYLEYFNDSLKEAAAITEYSRNSRFLENISNIIALFISEILNSLATGGKIVAIETMKELAGDTRDFIHGVNVARINLGVDMSHSKEDRAAFWKKYVWPNDIIYDKTIQARFGAWGELAPYWELIENGNMGSTLAYPQFPATNFFSNALTKIEMDLAQMTGYQKEKREGKEDKTTAQREIEVIEAAQRQLLEHPEYYQPGDVLARINNIESGREYLLYVTQKRGELGFKRNK